MRVPSHPLSDPPTGEIGVNGVRPICKFILRGWDRVEFENTGCSWLGLEESRTAEDSGTGRSAVEGIANVLKMLARREEVTNEESDGRRPASICRPAPRTTRSPSAADRPRPWGAGPKAGPIRVGLPDQREHDSHADPAFKSRPGTRPKSGRLAVRGYYVPDCLDQSPHPHFLQYAEGASVQVQVDDGDI